MNYIYLYWWFQSNVRGSIHLIHPLWNRDGSTKLCSIKQGSVHIASISQLIDEDGFPSKGLKSDTSIANTFGSWKTEFCSSIQVAFFNIHYKTNNQTYINFGICFITLCPLYLFIIRALRLQTDEVLKHFPFRTHKTFTSLGWKDKGNESHRNQSVSVFRVETNGS